MREGDGGNMVGGGNPREKFMTQLAGRHLDGLAGLRGGDFDIRAAGLKRPPEDGCGLPDELFVGVAGTAPQSVIEVGNDNFPVVGRGQRMQRVQEHHGIHAAGDGSQNGLAAREQTPLLHGHGDTLKEFGHASILRFF